MNSPYQRKLLSAQVTKLLGRKYDARLTLRVLNFFGEEMGLKLWDCSNDIKVIVY
jgi:hypothetical protein